MNATPGFTASLLAALLLTAAPADAQEAFSGSESYVAQIRALRSAGGLMQRTYPNDKYDARVVLGGAVAGPADSSTRELWAGIAPIGTTPLKNSPPLVFSVSPDAGPKLGGGTLTVTGFGFSWPDAGQVSIDFDGVPVAGAAALGNTQATAPIPPGMNSLVDFDGNPIEGNPLGGVDVAAHTLLGSDTLHDGYAYLPALIQMDEATLDDTFVIRFRSLPGSITAMSAGWFTPGLGIPIPGFEGALEVYIGLIPIGVETADADGRYDYHVYIPNKPQLVGKSIWFQTASIDSVRPFAGAFSNVLDIVVQP